MDHNRFDALARMLVLGLSRRGALAGLAALTAFRLAPADETEGKRKKKKKKKRKKKENENNNTPEPNRPPGAGVPPQPECRVDGDCPETRESCQGGRCQLVCPNGACGADCNVCVVHLENDGVRSRLCGDSVGVPGQLTTCDRDADCPGAAPLCIRFNEGSCAEALCGTCVESVSSCNQPECQSDGDCTDQTRSCQGGSCQPVCQAGACAANCGLCFVRFEANGDRSPACGDTFSLGDSCTTDDDCGAAGEVCIRVPPQVCAEEPCRQCSFIPACED